jgi:hypothetical protein
MAYECDDVHSQIFRCHATSFGMQPSALLLKQPVAAPMEGQRFAVPGLLIFH